MNIRLNISEPTFRNYFTKIGYSYKIKQYDNFIKSIQRMVLSDIKDAFINNNIKEKLKTIFGEGKNITINILSDKNNILTITDKYLKELIEESRLDIYLEETKTITFKKELQELAHKKIKLSEILTKGSNVYLIDKMDSLFKNSNYVEERVKKCIAMDAIDLSEEEINLLNNEAENRVFYALVLFEQHRNYDIILNMLSTMDININNSRTENVRIIKEVFLKKMKKKINLYKTGILNFSIDISDSYNDEISEYTKENNLNLVPKYTNKDSISELTKVITIIKNEATSALNNKFFKMMVHEKENRGSSGVDYEKLAKGRISLDSCEFNDDIYDRLESFLRIFSENDFGLRINRRKYREFKYIFEKRTEIDRLQSLNIKDDLIKISYGDFSKKISLSDIKEYSENEFIPLNKGY